MATTNFSQTVNALETAIASATLTGTAGGAASQYMLGAAIDNRPTAGSVIAYDLADLTITLSSAVIAVAPAYLTVWILPAVDGTNYPSPPATAGAGPLALAYTFQMVAGSTTTLICPNIPIPPYLFKVQVQNNLGVAFPTGTTSTCQLVRKSVAGW